MICAFGWLWLIPGGSHAVSPSAFPTRRTVRAVEKEAPVPEDVVRFTNGNVLSGEVAEIADGSVFMKPEMAERTLRIPVGAVKEVVFKDRSVDRSLVADRLLLVNGEALNGRIERMAEGKVSLSMPSGQKVEVAGQKVAAIAFYRGAEVLAEESFESELPKGMHFEGGEWRTQRGWLLQTDSRAVECFASLPAMQTGEVVYEWTVNTTIGRSTGIYFMASDPGFSQERAYFFRILRAYVYVYLCVNGEEVYCGSYRISLYRNKNDVRLKCDSGRGMIIMWINGAEVGRWKSSVPIKRGEYVALRADGRAAFDDLTVVRAAGAVRVTPLPTPGEGDVLALVNGDEISATVKAVSERSVAFAVANSDEVRQIGREKLLYVRFNRTLEKLPRGRGGTVVLVMRNGDRISGKLLSLREKRVRIQSKHAGVVDLRLEDARKVIFKEFP